ncbi:hypothetical protein FRC03_009052 [Tulasnella sp. 419]|nr:hypothetical protein FRC02_003860 [Tulasnella sp. 418]KAG8958502.1 hypothetical protein FRC03_009052 [Tulasnella sp. 419]
MRQLQTAKRHIQDQEMEDKRLQLVRAGTSQPENSVTWVSKPRPLSLVAFEAVCLLVERRPCLLLRQSDQVRFALVIYVDSLSGFATQRRATSSPRRRLVP